MQLEDLAYYIINKSIELSHLKQEDKYLLNYDKLLFMLFITECFYVRDNQRPLFAEDFFVSAKGLAIGIEKENNYDLMINNYLKQRLFIFENPETQLYSNPTFNITLEDSLQNIIDYVTLNYGFLSLSLLKGLLNETLNMNNDYNYKLIRKSISKRFIENDSLNDINENSRK